MKIATLDKIHDLVVVVLTLFWLYTVVATGWRDHALGTVGMFLCSFGLVLMWIGILIRRWPFRRRPDR